MKVEELIEKRMLLECPPSRDKAMKSLEISGKYLSNARANFKMGLHTVTVLLTYNSMFHAARALLFKDGYKERSHWAVVEYLRGKYAVQLGEGPINKFDTFRVLRHSAAYGLESKEDREESKIMREFAEIFLNKIKELI